MTASTVKRQEVFVRIVGLGDAHKLDRISSVTVRVIDQTELTIGFLYFRYLGSLTHDNTGCQYKRQ